MTPCFVLDDRLLRPAGEPRVAFLISCLRALDRTLGGRLVVRRGDPAVEVPRLAQETAPGEVFAAGDFGPTAAGGTRPVATALAGQGAGLRLVGSPYAVDPGTVEPG